MNSIVSQIRPAVISLLLLSLLTGGLYPLVVTGIAQVAFPFQANGSLIVHDNQIRGSVLIGQDFSDPGYFWSRPSATGQHPYNAFHAASQTGSAGSNLGPLNPVLYTTIQVRIDALRVADPQATPPYPADLVTTSASGLDPHISPAAAAYQIRRVAQNRGLSEEQVQQLVLQYTEGRDFNLLGEPRVNVVRLNLALDSIE
ncbi:potassium-transporting ATPase subunit KdpC [Candidatus Oscillochloris fontis]|uniref:potassium-transporting ATPase subunit KdpC n=1 Tax=Candidatus Oscillochloris fontis TaxID=2496868 RepID=UPI00101D2505|nr:potassium-transporting ATPase subunit KdpC [Candidatus Oscillochloris fontis]